MTIFIPYEEHTTQASSNHKLQNFHNHRNKTLKCPYNKATLRWLRFASLFLFIFWAFVIVSQCHVTFLFVSLHFIFWIANGTNGKQESTSKHKHISAIRENCECINKMKPLNHWNCSENVIDTDEPILWKPWCIQFCGKRQWNSKKRKKKNMKIQRKNLIYISKWKSGLKGDFYLICQGTITPSGEK